MVTGEQAGLQSGTSLHSATLGMWPSPDSLGSSYWEVEASQATLPPEPLALSSKGPESSFFSMIYWDLTASLVSVSDSKF